MAMLMTIPTIGSASRQPAMDPTAAAITARDVSPSVRACSPSATRAAEPMRRPTRMR